MVKNCKKIYKNAHLENKTAPILITCRCDKVWSIVNLNITSHQLTIFPIMCYAIANNVYSANLERFFNSNSWACWNAGEHRFIAQTLAMNLYFVIKKVFATGFKFLKIFSLGSNGPPPDRLLSRNVNFWQTLQIAMRDSSFWVYITKWGQIRSYKSISVHFEC